MKKIYLEPEIEMVPIDMSQSILAGSDPDITTNLDGLDISEEDGIGLFAD